MPTEVVALPAANTTFRIVPITRLEAQRFIGHHHRHNIASIGAVFQVGLAAEDGQLIGAAMVGTPKARMLCDGLTLEVTRVCVLEGMKNANSALYGACARAAKALGYTRLVTYTLTTESGASLRATGWTCEAELPPRDPVGWANGGSRPRPAVVDLFGFQRLPGGAKYRWRKELA